MSDSVQKVNATVAAHSNGALAVMVRDSMNVVMSSKDIAHITAKDHKNVLRDIRSLLDGSKLSFEQKQGFTENRATVNGRDVCTHYDLDFKATLLVVTGYDAEKRAAVIERWYELEKESAAPPAPVATIDQERFDQMQDALTSLANSMATLTTVIAKVIEKPELARSVNPAAPPAPVDDFGIDPRQDFSISELAAMLNQTPNQLRLALIKEKAILSGGARAWVPTEGMIKRDYCVFVPMVGWKFNRLGAVNIVKYYSSKLA